MRDNDRYLTEQQMAEALVAAEAEVAALHERIRELSTSNEIMEGRMERAETKVQYMTPVVKAAITVSDLHRDDQLRNTDLDGLRRITNAYQGATDA